MAGGVAVTGARALVAQLEELGVEVVFGIPGVHNLDIFDALRRSSIRTIVVRHEQTAGYAADGYARATGKLGVCVTTTGPGAANTAAAMGEARASRSPVLHISTQVDSRILDGKTGRFSLHESPQQVELMGAVANWAARVARPEAIASMVAHAAQEAFAGRRGPAFLEIPHDFLSARVVKARRAVPAPFAPPAPDEDEIARAADALDEAKRPIVWAGGGVISSGATEELLTVAELLDAPVVTTFAGKGAVPADHPLCVGFPPHQPEVTKLITGSDALLAVGSDFDAMNTQGWRIPFPHPRVVINIENDDLRRNYAAEVAIEADARPTLGALAVLLEPRKRGGAKRVTQTRDAARRSLTSSREFKQPFAFVETLRKAVPDDAMVIADMAIAGYWAAAYFPATGPRTFAYPLGWGTLGFAFPAAIGAAAAGRKTVVTCGDAGFLFAPAELATAVQEQLDITVLLVNDGGYGMLRFDEDERFSERFAVDLTTPDFVALARSFGAKARKTTVKKLSVDLVWGIKQRGPVVIELDARWAPPLTTSPRWPLKGKREARP
jgi:thiamine pyrophosphate-dependent acetolactate synthase large subunit-like protein